MVDSLVVSAEDDDVLLEGQLVGYALVEDVTVRGHVDDLVVMPFGLQFLYHPENRFDHHHHAGVAAVAVVVDVLPGADAVFAELVYMDLHQAFLYGPSDNGVAQRTLQQFGYDGQDIYSHISVRQIE